MIFLTDISQDVLASVDPIKNEFLREDDGSTEK